MVWFVRVFLRYGWHPSSQGWALPGQFCVDAQDLRQQSTALFGYPEMLRVEGARMLLMYGMIVYELLMCKTCNAQVLRV